MRWMSPCGWPPVALGAWLVVSGLVAAQAPASAAGGPPEGGIRTVVLVRHGVYDEDDPRDPEVGKALTAIGETQAWLTGAWLARLPRHFDALYSSPLTRARQTAQIIGESLGGMTPQVATELRECTPPTERPDVMARQTPGGPDSCRAALERGWQRFFRPSPARDSTVVLVCHGNVIRYFVARALGLDPERWLDMTIANCSLSIVEVRADGRTRLVSFDDVGHLPPELQVYPPIQWDPGPSPKRK